jgi:hypothetical protein
VAVCFRQGKNRDHKARVVVGTYTSLLSTKKSLCITKVTHTEVLDDAEQLQTTPSSEAKGEFAHIMPFRSHLIYTVRPCSIHICYTVALPCHEYAVLKATSQGRGRGAAGERHDMCELASPSRDGMWARMRRMAG